MMLFDHLLRDRQSQPDAAEEVVALAFEVIEAIEDAAQVFLWDTDAVIFDGDDNLLFAFAQAHVHVTAPGAELDGVVHQRHERTLEGFRVA